MNLKNLLIISLLLFFIPVMHVHADGDLESNRFTISGYVKDGGNGEALIGATVFVKELKTGTNTNRYGYYSISLPAGKYTLSFNYVGYALQTKAIDLRSNMTYNADLKAENQQLDEVVVTGERPDRNIRQPEMSVAKLQMKTIRQIPALMGEVDIIKAIQMLPGVLPTSEGTSGFSVRGGGIDQNLIILDEAPVYNASHLMGFFSVFNNDAISDVKLYKGDIPAYYGGRLSSVLDVRMKEGNNRRFEATGGIGLISSRLTLEGPIVNRKTSFLVSGRRTYADLFFPLATDSSVRKSKMYFYDLNFKINRQINNNNRVYLSAYLGRDNFGQKNSSDAGFGNKTMTLRWNHLFSQKLFSNFTGIVSRYDYSLSMEAGSINYNWNSSLQDYGLKVDFTYFANPRNELRFGFASTLHNLVPCNAWESNGDHTITVPYPRNNELEHAVYLSNQQTIGTNLTLKYGLRYSIFQNIGPGTIFQFDSAYHVKDTLNYQRGDIFNTYQNLEPRFGATYALNKKSSVKASYSRTVQYLQLASNSNGGMPLDVWFPSSPNVKPQRADQISVGYFRNFHNNLIETSVEAFYKKMYNVIDFKDNAQLLMNPRMEGDIRVGKAHAYGLEFLVRKTEGRLNGWISYTYSRSIRQIDSINHGKSYPSPYDKPNTINIILSYDLSNRATLSANWVYATGAPFTGPVRSILYKNDVIEQYGGRNSSRMRDYHRLDLALTVKNREHPGMKWHSEWVFSVYNAYGRHNDWIINFVPDKNATHKNLIKAERMYLPFVFFPSITYNFKF